MVFCPRWCQVSFASLGLVLFGGFLIVGIIINSVVENAIEAGVRSGTPLEKGFLSDSQYQNYTNSQIAATYYVFNITNLNAALTTPGTLLNVVSAPGVRLWKHTTRNNVVSSNGVTSFTSCITYEVQDQQSWNTMNMNVTVPNVVYFAAVAAVGRALFEQAEVNSGVLPGDPLFVQPSLINAQQGAAYNNDLLFNVFAQQKNALWSTINSTFSSPTGLLIPGFKMLSVAVYIQAAAQVLAGLPSTASMYSAVNSAPYGGPVGLLATHIASGGQISPTGAIAPIFPFYTSNFIGIEFPLPLSSFPAQLTTFQLQVGALFSTTSNFGLLSVAGLSGFWPKVLTAAQQALAGQPAAFLALANTIITATNVSLTVGDIQNVARWLSGIVGPALTADNSTDGFSVTVFTAVKLSLSKFPWFANSTVYTPLQSQFVPTTWEQLGLLQYGTGMVTSIVLDSSHGTTYGYNGIATSVSDPRLLGPAGQGGLGIALEFAANCASPPVFNPPVLLTTTQSQLLLYFLANANPTYTVLFYATSAQMPTALPALIQAGQSPSAAAAYVISKVCTAIGGCGSIIPADLTSLASLFVSSPNFPQCAFIYTANVNRVASATSPSLNSGMFITMTVGEVLFGQRGLQAAFGQSFPGVAASWANVSGPVVGQWGVQSTAQQQLASCLISESTRPYAQTSGSVDITALGQLVQYEGVSSFQTQCQFYDPKYVDICNGIDPFTQQPIKLVGDFNAYGGPVAIAGSYDGQYFPPLQEGNIVPSYIIFVSNVARAVPFNYNQSISFKNINLRRYTINNASLYGGTTTAFGPNDNYWRNAQLWNADATFPGGLINFASVKGGVPISVSQPHLVGVDAATANLLTGLDTNPANIPNYLSNVDIEPLTGRTMNANKRLQGNVYINPAQYPFYPVYTTLMQTYAAKGIPHVPLYWAEESASITDSDASSFVSTVYGSRSTANSVMYAGIIVGSVGVLVFIILLFRAVRPSETQ